MSFEGLQVVFKISYAEEKNLRRISFPQLKDITYSALYTKLSNLYNMTDFRIRYCDEENDLITIDNELDLQECFSYLSKINNKDSDKLIVRLTLAQEISQKTIQNTEYVVKDDVASNLDAPDIVTTTENQSGNVGFGLEKVINEGITNFQNIFQNLVTNMGTTLENDLNNLHSSLQQPIQQAINTVSNVVKTENNSDDDKDNNRSLPPLPSPSPSLLSSPPPSSPNNNTTDSNETEQIIKQEQTISQDPVIHHGVFCDCCKNTISGMRWKCLTCKNYDLCQVCKSKQPTIHNHENSHEFEPIPYPSNHCSRNSKRFTASLHSAVCDFCESQIYGIRHKCINCPDFDLCNSCISLAPTQHPNHTFMPIYRPGEPEIKLYDTVTHPGIRCDGCEKLIVGVRYKCVNCPNFDFCGNCEASPLNTHEITHIFLKVKFPVSIPIPSDSPLLLNYYARKESNTTDYELTGKQEYSKEKKSSSVNNDTENSSFYQPAITSPQPSIKDETIVSHAPIDLYKYSLVSTPLTQTQNQEIVNQYILDTNQTDDSNSILTKHENSLPEFKLESRFVENINFTDGTTLVPRAQFIKKWRMENNGNVAWPESTVLTFVGGSEMFGDKYSFKDNGGFHVGLVNVGEIKEVFAELQAPSESGEHTSYWRLVDGEGNKFGHRLCCIINVEDDDSNMTASSMIFPVMKNEPAQPDDIVDLIIGKSFIKRKSEAISSQSAITDSNNNNNEAEDNSEFDCDSDTESDVSSLLSLENSRDYFFVEKDDHLSEENDQKEVVKEKIIKEVVFEAESDDDDDDDVESSDEEDSENETEKSVDQ